MAIMMEMYCCLTALYYIHMFYVFEDEGSGGSNDVDGVLQREADKPRMRERQARLCSLMVEVFGSQAHAPMYLALTTSPSASRSFHVLT